MTTVPFIVDTDTAQDDCVALLVALLDPAADLRAVTMVNGNVSFDQQVKNALMTLNVAGYLGKVPVYLGSRRPLVRPWVSAENVHGDGSGGLDMDFSRYAPESEHAVDALIRLTAERPGEISIVAIGPLTNIAMAVIKNQDFVRNVKRLVVMGGSNNGRGNITAAAEFNIYVDPHAADVVFRAGFDVTVIPWDPVTLRDAVFSRDQLATIRALNTPLADFFLRVCAATLEFDESVGIPGTTHPDSLSVGVLLHPELVTSVNGYNVQVETAAELTLGYTAMSWGVHGLANNAQVIESIDSAAFYELIRSTLATPTTPQRAIRTR